MITLIANMKNNNTAGARSNPIVLGKKDRTLEYIGSMTFRIEIQSCETI